MALDSLRFMDGEMDGASIGSCRGLLLIGGKELPSYKNIVIWAMRILQFSNSYHETSDVETPYLFVGCPPS